MKTLFAKGKISSSVNTALASTIGNQKKPQQKVLHQQLNDGDGELPAHKFWEDRQSLSERIEESLDFIGKDASERLGAARLRKV